MQNLIEKKTKQKNLILYYKILYFSYPCWKSNKVTQNPLKPCSLR